MLADSSAGLDLALVGVVAASVTTLGLVVRAMLQPLLNTASRIEEHVNGVDDGEKKLGQIVREGFASNDEAHRRLSNRVAGVEEKLDGHIADETADVKKLVALVTPDVPPSL